MSPKFKAAGRLSTQYSEMLRVRMDHASSWVYDVSFGYMIRCGVVGMLLFSGGTAAYSAFEAQQKTLPLAQRYNRLLPPTPITLVEKTIESNNESVTYRFQLPNSYDSAGYEPISAVLVSCGLRNHWRYLNPVSPPDAKGYIEFSVAHRNSLRTLPLYWNLLKVGDQVNLHRWLKEFRYEPNTYGELGLVCTMGSASVVLQVMHAMMQDPTDATKLKALYINEDANIPYKDTLFKKFVDASGGRFSIQYMVSGTLAKKDFTEGIMGRLSEEILAEVLPAPLVPLPLPLSRTGARPTSSSASAPTVSAAPPTTPAEARPLVRSKVLVSCTRTLQRHICGAHALSLYHYEKYLPIFAIEYHNTMLSDMGYLQSQTYPFGVVSNFWVSAR